MPQSWGYLANLTLKIPALVKCNLAWKKKWCYMIGFIVDRDRATLRM